MEAPRQIVIGRARVDVNKAETMVIVKHSETDLKQQLEDQPDGLVCENSFLDSSSSTLEAHSLERFTQSMVPHSCCAQSKQGMSDRSKAIFEMWAERNNHACDHLNAALRRT